MASTSDYTSAPCDDGSCSVRDYSPVSPPRPTQHGRSRTCVLSMAQEQTPSSIEPKARHPQACGGYMIRPLMTEWCSDGSTRFNIQDYPLQALMAMNVFRQSGELCDIVLEVQGKRISAHKLVLAACSLYFRGMFTHGMMEASSSLVTIREPSITAETMRILVDFAYTQVIHITQNNVQSVLLAAIFLEMTHVIEACSLYMEQQLHPSNCIGFAMFGRQHGCRDLENNANKFIVEHFCHVITYDEVLGLGTIDFSDLIGNDKLNIRCESEVFKAVIRWVEHDPETRQGYMESLLQKVRLSSLAPGFLENQLKKCSIIKENPLCEQLLAERVSHLVSHQTCPIDLPRKTCKSRCIYVVGGFCRKTMESMACFECYDPRTKEWNRLPDLPISRSLPGVTSLKGQIYVLGGRLRKCSQDFDSCSVNLYDPLDNKWSTRCAMSQPRNRVGVGILDNFIYAVGGRSGGELFKSAERYDPEQDCWSPIADMKCVRMSPGIAVVNRLMYAVGGTDEKNQRLQSVECYHPEMNKWHEVAPLAHPRSAAGVAVLNNQIYAVGGFDGQNQLQSVECYDVKTKVWRQVAPLPRARSGVEMATVSDKLYILGGFDGTDFVSNVECYDPVTDSWHSETNMLSKRSGHGVAVAVAPEHL